MNTGINLEIDMLDINKRKNDDTKVRKQKNLIQYNREIPGRRRDDYIERAIQGTLFNEIPLAIYFQDLKLHYISVNQAFAEFVGRSPKEIVGKSIFDLLPADQAEKLQTHYDLALKTGKKLTNIYQWITDAQGEDLYLSIVIAPFYDNKGHIAGLVSTHNDISHSVKASLINNNLLRENRLLTQKLFNIQEEERRNLARDLHDELGQWLIAIQTEIQEMKTIAGDNTLLQSCIHTIREYTQSMHRVIRGMLHKLRPVVLDSLGLTECLQEQKKEWCIRHPGIDYELIINAEFKNIKESISITVYRLIQESLNNICIHAQATKVQIELSRTKNERLNSDDMCLRIKDNGIGFDTSLKTKGYGLLGMRERIISTGGDFALHSSPGKGTLIYAKLLLDLQEELSQ